MHLIPKICAIVLLSPSYFIYFFFQLCFVNKLGISSTKFSQYENNFKTVLKKLHVYTEILLDKNLCVYIFIVK